MFLTTNPWATVQVQDACCSALWHGYLTYLRGVLSETAYFQYFRSMAENSQPHASCRSELRRQLHGEKLCGAACRVAQEMLSGFTHKRNRFVRHKFRTLSLIVYFDTIINWFICRQVFDPSVCKCTCDPDSENERLCNAMRYSGEDVQWSKAACKCQCTRPPYCGSDQEWHQDLCKWAKANASVLHTDLYHKFVLIYQL